MRRSALLVPLALLLAAGCSSLRDQAVPGCPYCGDPVTKIGADGRAVVVPRWHLASSWGSGAGQAVPPPAMPAATTR